MSKLTLISILILTLSFASICNGECYIEDYDPQNQDQIVIENNQVFRKFNQGMEGHQIYTLYSKDNVMFAGTHMGPQFGPRLFKSTNNEYRWRPVTQLNKMLSLAIEKIFAVGSTNNNTYVSDDGYNVYKSDGSFWEKIKLTLKSKTYKAQIYAFHTIDNILYAGGRGVIKINSDNSIEQFGDGIIVSLHSIDSTLYAGDFSGKVYKINTADPNYKWLQVGQKKLEATRSTPLTSLNKTLYVGTSNGIFKINTEITDDDWKGAGLEGKEIISLASMNCTLYAAIKIPGKYLNNPSSLYKSTDGGGTWISLNDKYDGNDYPDPLESINTLYANNNNLYIGTDYGVLKRVRKGWWDITFSSAKKYIKNLLFKIKR